MDLHTKIVPIPYIRRLLEVSREQGISAQQLLEGSGLSTEEVTTPGGYITQAQQIQIWTNGVRLSTESDIGLRMGKGYRTQDLGIYGLAIQTTANFHQATEVADRFVRLAAGYTDFELTVTDEEYRVRASVNYPLPGTHQLAIDESLCGYHASFSHLVDQPITPTRVTLDYPKPQHAERYREFFGCPVQFSAKHSELIYPRAYGELPVKYYDVDANEVCIQRCEKLLLRLLDAENMEGRVRKTLLQLGCNRRNAEEVAERLHISPRHLRRTLSEEGTSFQKVLDAVRYELSKNYLEQTVLTIEQMAPLIGFTETNNFRRAFKKWSGLSPTVYRNQLQH